MDLQGNASTLITCLTGVKEIITSIFEGFQNGSLKECIVEVTDNLHMIPAQVSFKHFPKFLYTTVKEEINQVSYLKKLLDPIREDYDYIFIDVPPTISDFWDNMMMAADYVLIIVYRNPIVSHLLTEPVSHLTHCVFFRRTPRLYLEWWA